MEITVTESEMDRFGGVWVKGRGPADKCDAVERAVKAYARKRKFGGWITSGASFEDKGKVVEWRFRYHPGKES